MAPAHFELLVIIVFVAMLTACRPPVLAPSKGADYEHGFALIKDLKAAATFVLPGNQTDIKAADRQCILAAVEDFNKDLKECTGGIGLPVTDTDDGNTPVIRFELESRPLAAMDRFAVTFPDSRTMLITGGAPAIRFALNHILEKFAGIRYLARAENATHFPKITDLAVTKSGISMSPSCNLSRNFGQDRSCLFWAERMNSTITPKTFFRIPMEHDLAKVAFPVDKYMAENKWPDYIFPTIDGKKFLPYNNPAFKTPANYNSYWQPCLTSKETVDEAVKNICYYFDKNPEVFAISLAVNDGGGFCQCENCNKLGGLKRNATGHLDYSELYYTWVNRVVGEVAKKHPDKYFGVLAYREALSPPSFKLHKNIVPYICFDMQTCMDPDVKSSWTKLLRDWADKAANLGHWEYGYGIRFYDLPRVYFGLQREMMKTAHENNVRAMFVSAGGAIEDGPKKYLYHKLMWNVDADLDALLNDWYEACVGKKAAPYLSEYFRLWEKFWREEAVKTDWFVNSRKATYLNLADKTYLYAVGREDLPKMRQLMEKVVELTGQYGDKRQKLRAGWMMREFEYSEACVYAIGGQIFPHSGAVENVGQALEYLKTLPEAARYDLKRAAIFNERSADPDLGKGGLFQSYRHTGSYVFSALAKIASFCHDPKVMEAFRNAAKNTELTPDIRGLCNVFVKLETNQTIDNLLKDGSFENGGPSLRVGKGWTGGNISSNQAFGGCHSLMLNLSPGTCVLRLINENRITVKAGSYLVSAMIYLRQDHPDVEEKVVLSADAQRVKDGDNSNIWQTPETYITPGKWTRISLVANISPGTETFGFRNLTFKNFAKGDMAFIDDIIIVLLVGENQDTAK